MTTAISLLHAPAMTDTGESVAPDAAEQFTVSFATPRFKPHDTDLAAVNALRLSTRHAVEVSRNKLTLTFADGTVLIFAGMLSGNRFRCAPWMTGRCEETGKLYIIGGGAV